MATPVINNARPAAGAAEADLSTVLSGGCAARALDGELQVLARTEPVTQLSARQRDGVFR